MDRELKRFYDSFIETLHVNEIKLSVQQLLLQMSLPTPSQEIKETAAENLMRWACHLCVCVCVCVCVNVFSGSS